MELTFAHQLNGPALAGRTDAERRGEAGRLKVAELAREFEATLLVQMVRQMRQSLLDEEDQEKGLGHATLIDTLDVELARELAAKGGIGLAQMIEQGLAARAPTPGEPDDSRDVGETAKGVGMATPRPAVEPPAETNPARQDAVPDEPGASASEAFAQGLVIPLVGAVTSGYGYRPDPFHGLRKFHAGVDFRAAYGQEVPVAGAGRVAFAGEQGAYGLTVVVDHGGGVQTRYAHLSAIGAAVGQELAQGEVVGRVGQSGRATGPHLHFEVLMDGRRVDPTQVARRLPAGLKNLAAGDDYAFDRDSTGDPANGVTNEN